MPWFQVDDQLGFHPKAVAAGNAAMGLWVRAGSWCALHLTEGAIPASIARSMGTPAQIKRLVQAGLWIPTEEGYAFHQWGDRQLSKEEIEERRRKRADAGRKGGQKSGETRRDGSKTGSGSEANASAGATPSAEAVDKQVPQQNPTPVPVLVPGSGYVGEGSLVANARENDPPPPHCSEHPGGTTDPCRACADHRKHRQRWDAEQPRLKAAADSERAHRAAEDRRRAVDECGLCDSAGYVGAVVCSHDPDEADRAKRGMAQVREALGRRDEP